MPHVLPVFTTASASYSEQYSLAFSILFPGFFQYSDAVMRISDNAYIGANLVECKVWRIQTLPEMSGTILGRNA